MVRRELLEAIKSAPLLQASKAGLEAGTAVSASTRQDLARLLIEARTVLGWSPGPYEIPATVGHEAQHAFVAKKLGAVATDFSLRFIRIPTITNPDGFMRMVPATQSQFCRPLSRLESALLAAYPSCPSDGDVLAVQQLGYEDVDEVAEHAIAVNRDFGDSLPVPPWARAPDWSRIKMHG